jgi:hypothetical protein
MGDDRGESGPYFKGPLLNEDEMLSSAHHLSQAQAQAPDNSDKGTMSCSNTMALDQGKTDMPDHLSIRSHPCGPLLNC